MSSDLDKVVACLKFLDLHPSMHDYKWRFLTQKIAFLTKALGVNIGYEFTIYVAGPYSRELNCEYYPNEVKDRIDELETHCELSKDDTATLLRIKNCHGLLENQNLLEATTTAVYLIKKNACKSEDSLFLSLKLIKPHISDSDRVIAISKAKELLFKPDYLNNELKQEMDEWDRLES